MARRSYAALCGAAVYGIALALIALWPTHVDSGFDAVTGTAVGRWLLEQGLTRDRAYSLIEFGANVLLYLPLGIVTMTLWRRARWWQACFLALAVSGAFELLQMGLRPGRTADPGDVAANTIGAALGVALFTAWRSSRRRIPTLNGEGR